MKNAIIGGLVVIMLAGAAFVFIDLDEVENLPSFEKLSSINQVILATFEYTDECDLKDDKGLGEGRTLYSWEFQFGYGVEIPANWQWSIKGEKSGEYYITLPELSQLRPHKVQASEEIINPANAKRSKRMRETAIVSATKRMAAAEDAALATNPKVLETARKSAMDFFTPILSSANPSIPVKSVTVLFDNENSISGAQFITLKTCT